MKLIIEEILASKGLKWKDLADRTGRDQSNLRASLKKNPTMAVLGEVAEALGLSIPELFEGGTTIKKPLGRVQIGGQLYELTEPSDKALRIPEYNDYSQLREKLTKFIKEHETARGDIIEDSSSLVHLYHKGRFTKRNIVGGTHACENLVENAYPGCRCGHIATNLSHKYNEGCLSEQG